LKENPERKGGGGCPVKKRRLGEEISLWLRPKNPAVGKIEERERGKVGFGESIQEGGFV